MISNKFVLYFLLQIIPVIILLFWTPANKLKFTKKKLIIINFAVLLILSFVLFVLIKLSAEKAYSLVFYSLVFASDILFLSLFYLCIKDVRNKKRFYISVIYLFAVIIILLPLILTELSLNSEETLDFRLNLLIAYSFSTSLPVCLFFYKKIISCINYLNDKCDIFVLKHIFIISEIFAGLNIIFALIVYFNRSNILNLILFIITITFLSMFYMFIKLIISMQEDWDKKTLKSIEYISYSKLKDKIDQIKETTSIFEKYQEDCVNSIAIVKNLLLKKDFIKLESFLNEKSATTLLRDTVFCNNELINIILSYYFKKAKNLNAKISYKINLNENLSLIQNDICIILASCMENTFKDFELVPENRRFITLSMVIINRTLAITMDNSCNFIETIHDASKDENIIFSNINFIAEKYNGGTSFVYEYGVLHSSIMLIIPHTK